LISISSIYSQTNIAEMKIMNYRYAELIAKILETFVVEINRVGVHSFSVSCYSRSYAR